MKLVLLLIALELTVISRQAVAKKKVSHRFKSYYHNFNNTYVGKLEASLKAVKNKVYNCTYFHQFYRETRARAIKILERGKLDIMYRKSNEKCGDTYPLIFPNRVYLYDQSFTGPCRYVKNVLFHEIVHLANRKLPEEVVQHIEVMCIRYN